MAERTAVISLKGRTYEVIVSEATNMGTEEKPDWYITGVFTKNVPPELAGMACYWKQGLDGGKLVKLDPVE